ncbi:hypothetical protein IJI31_05495 [bacterium]|nr:hypothetical protein [bacterium]
MGMSSSQVRLLALTSRLHDVEFQAQSIMQSKMELADSADAAYNEYVAALDETKYQMEVFTGTEFQFQDVTYNAMINASSGGSHSMYLLTDAFTNAVLLPETLDSSLDDSDSCSQFLDKVAVYLKGTGSDASALNSSELNYWKSVYYQIYGYQQNGKHVQGIGHKSVPDSVMSDGDWLQKMVENAYAVIRKMTMQEEKITDGENIDKFNIFADSSVSTDTSLREIPDTIKLKLAEAKYESENRKIDQKESQLDMQLTKLETERKAITTEYDSVKKVISDNIERSFKTFNA